MNGIIFYGLISLHRVPRTEQANTIATLQKPPFPDCGSKEIETSIRPFPFRGEPQRPPICITTGFYLSRIPANVSGLSLALGEDIPVTCTYVFDLTLLLVPCYTVFRRSSPVGSALRPAKREAVAI